MREILPSFLLFLTKSFNLVHLLFLLESFFLLIFSKFCSLLPVSSKSA